MGRRKEKSAASTGTKPKRKMPVGKPWPKGVSGNPGGMHKGVAEVPELAGQWVPQAIQTLADLMLDPKTPAPARALCATSLLDRYAGKPKQLTEVDVSIEFDGWSAAQLRQYLIDGMSKLGLVELSSEAVDVTDYTEAPAPTGIRPMLPYDPEG